MSTNFTPDPRTPMRNHLAELRAAAEAAGEREIVARRRLAGERAAVAVEDGGTGGDAPSGVGREVFADLAAYRSDIEFRRPAAVEEGKRGLWERELTERIIAEVRERGLVFSPNSDGWSVTLVDPSLRAGVDAALAERMEAHGAAERFERENHAELIAEADAAQTADFKAAITAGDTEAVAGFITLTQEAQRRRDAADAAMTTNDLPQRQRVTRGA
jgi:hypothetical protein